MSPSFHVSDRADPLADRSRKIAERALTLLPFNARARRLHLLALRAASALISSKWERCTSELISTTSRRCVRLATPPCPIRKNAEPDPIAAASICERAGAHGITAHLRADRRHIQDRDMERLRANIMTKLNFEMGNTPEILDVAIRIRPDDVCLVPEKRAEVTTEGGLDAIASRRDLLDTIQRLHANGIRVSLFIDPDEKQIDCATGLGWK
jgi:hypothetical protein